MGEHKKDKINYSKKNILQIKLDKEFIKKNAEKELMTIAKILERPNMLPDEELERLEILYESFLQIKNLY